MRYAKFVFLAAAAAAACGGISDPTRRPDGAVVTVSGELRGANPAPSNARVAVVWRTGQKDPLSVGAEAPLVGGAFTMSLAAPPDSYFSAASGDAPSGSIAPGQISAGGTPDSPAVNATASDAGTTSPRDVSGQTSDDLTGAVAGFVVYADGNGNGRLDLSGAAGVSPDQILGGNKELVLVYMRGGGALDYEKLRDKAGVLPVRGFNLSSTDERWFALDLVELKLAATSQLPGAVCGRGTAFSSPDNGTPLPMVGGGSAGVGRGITCASDGRSYQYQNRRCATSTTPASGLCGVPSSVTECTDGVAVYALPPEATFPQGWPCPTTTDNGNADSSNAASGDGGVMIDSGRIPTDASTQTPDAG